MRNDNETQFLEPESAVGGQVSKRFGYVALLGAPNAGKSTLLNACIGTKIAAVSNKPQTTRTKTLGITLVDQAQVLFLDTPGIHKTDGLPALNRVMNGLAWGVLKDCDILCYLIDVTTGWTEIDERVLKEIFAKYGKRVLVLATKSDKIKKEQVAHECAVIRSKIEELQKDLGILGSVRWNPGGELQAADAIDSAQVDFPIPFSAKKKEDVSWLCRMFADSLPEGEWLYDADAITDKSQKFICSEFVREQLFRQLGLELPYKVAVTVDNFEFNGKITKISATIFVERDSHKPIVIGKNGEQIKRIGIHARESIERHLQTKVHLSLFVKVKKGWTENTSMLADLIEMHPVVLDPI